MGLLATRHSLAACAAAVALGVASTTQAVDSPGLHASSIRPIMTAVSRGDCRSAVQTGNEGVNAGDPQVLFLIGRMVNEGICIAPDRKAATTYFSRATELGNHGSALDFAIKVGLGEGVEQSYERAGELCRAGGVDPGGQMSRYSLGYACTVAGLTAELLRTTLPRGAFRSGALRVSFTPSTGVMEIRSTPSVALADESTGTNVHHPLVDAPRAITRAWNNALTQVPKPDTSILDKLTVEMPLDVDMTLESAGMAGNGREPNRMKGTDVSLAPPPAGQMKAGH